jgi:hypothetical protein
MKTSVVVRIAVLALMSSTSLIAHAGSDDSVAQCMSVFAKQNFADQSTSFNAETPRVANSAFPSKVAKRTVRVVANDRASGREIASGHCTVVNGIAKLSETNGSEKLASIK